MVNGSAVTRVRVGDRIFGTWGHATMHVMAEAERGRPAVPGRRGPAHRHLQPYRRGGAERGRDARSGLATSWSVFGSASGADRGAARPRLGHDVVGVDPVAKPRAVAEHLGADRTLDPTAAPIST